MFRKFLNKINKNKLIIILIFIIVVLTIIKFTSGQKKEEAVVLTNIKNNSVIKENEVKITPTEVVEINNEEKINQIENERQQGYLSINDYAFPHEENTFLAEKHEKGKVYAKYKIDDKAKAERDLKYWYYIEIGATLPSDKIVWQ